MNDDKKFGTQLNSIKSRASFKCKKTCFCYEKYPFNVKIIGYVLLLLCHMFNIFLRKKSIRLIIFNLESCYAKFEGGTLRAFIIM